MKTTDLISILMPVKNEELYLEDCLNSVINQSDGHWELHAVNDHSEDQSSGILNYFEEKDPRIKVYENEGRGIIPALEKAFSKSKGKFVTRMDADDLMAERKLELMKKALIKAGKNHVATGKVRYFPENKVRNGFRRYAEWLNNLTENENNFSDIYKECVIPSPSWMMWRDEFASILQKEGLDYPEDYHLTFRMYARGMQVAGVRETVHHWRDHSERASRNDPNYANQLFQELKVPFFLEHDRNTTKELVLWGAGTKAKKIAKELKKHKAEFRWITNNEDKIGKHIYGIEIEADHRPGLYPEAQFIIAISAPEAVTFINRQLKKLNLKKGKDFFWFC